ncbi:MAG: SET domain-containing protein [Candidatus Sungbacteria bacterium]|nr:SET domain-containing protein [Candidatus Sungbacteria bacterium]
MKKLVDELNVIARSVYAQLKPSRVHGVGVFAIRDIRKGIEPFEDGREDGNRRFYRLPVSDLKKLPAYFVDVIKNYSVRERDFYWVSLGSWNTYSLQDFLNHSERPNMALKGNDRFVAIRNIKKGEELAADYRTFDGSWQEKVDSGRLRARRG